MRREEERSERKWLSELSRIFFRKCASQGKIGENCTRDGSQLLCNIVIILNNL